LSGFVLAVLTWREFFHSQATRRQSLRGKAHASFLQYSTAKHSTVNHRQTHRYTHTRMRNRRASRRESMKQGDTIPTRNRGQVTYYTHANRQNDRMEEQYSSAVNLFSSPAQLRQRSLLFACLQSHPDSHSPPVATGLPHSAGRAWSRGRRGRRE